MNEVVCFHNPDEDNGYLSNWHISHFSYRGIKYSSMEQYMMHQKALCFKDQRIAALIMKTDDVKYIKELGRKVQPFDDLTWNGVRQIIIYNGLIQKFFQNPDLKKLLLETEDSILAECAVNDRIWGIGLSMHDDDRLNPAKWNGQNLLGYALMMARERLRCI